MMRVSLKSSAIAKYLFIFSVVVTLVGGSYAYGVYSYQQKIFPIPLLRIVRWNLQELMFPSDAILAAGVDTGPTVETRQPERLAPGLVMVVGSIHGTRDTFVRIIDRSGTVIHEWIPRWADVWGDQGGNFPADRRPRGNNGMYLHGIDLLPDASFVANFEHLSTFRMNVCGEVEWKLDNLGHHSVFYSDRGYVWVTAERYVETGETGYPNHKAPLRSWMLQKIGLDGEVLEDFEIIDILRKNDLYGLLFLSTLFKEPHISGDALHLNDVDEFPSGMASEIFDPGDVMVSLRNINAIFVFDPATLQVKFLSIGRYVGQHDPDFLSGDRISVFDNRNRKPSAEEGARGGRIIEVDARTSTESVVLDGRDRFFTALMGVHQRIANGNILVTSSGEGRAIEFSPDGAVVWIYRNKISDDRNGRIYMASLLPEHMNSAFFKQALDSCTD